MCRPDATRKIPSHEDTLKTNDDNVPNTSSSPVTNAAVCKQHHDATTATDKFSDDKP